MRSGSPPSSGRAFMLGYRFEISAVEITSSSSRLTSPTASAFDSRVDPRLHRSIGPVAQWIRHRPTEPGIASSSPAGVTSVSCSRRGDYSQTFAQYVYRSDWFLQRLVSFHFHDIFINFTLYRPRIYIQTSLNKIKYKYKYVNIDIYIYIYTDIGDIYIYIHGYVCNMC